MNKKLIALTCFVLSIFTPLSFSKTTVDKNNNNVSVLFIQHATKGTFTPIADKPGFFVLKLKGVNEYIQFFTDRPHRTAGAYPTNKFLQKWQEGSRANSFNQEPPNAALSAVEGRVLKKKMVNVIIQLSSPSYDAKSRTLTYIAHPLNGQLSSVPMKQFENIALFIDSFCASCSGTGF